jgi:hypothetical protein
LRKERASTEGFEASIPGKLRLSLELEHGFDGSEKLKRWEGVS